MQYRQVPEVLQVPTGDTDLTATLGSVAWLPRDPTTRLAPGRFERATWTPEGSGTVDVAGFDPPAQPLRDLWRRHGRWRIARTGTLWHDLACLVVQQRIDRISAADQWRRLVTAHGSPAPGVDGLWAPPAPATLARLSPVDLHRLGLERTRASTLVGAGLALARHQHLADDDVAPGTAALRAVPGIGPWTTGCLAALTWGDRDAVIPGDSGIPSLVAWVLAGRHRADDAAMLDLLEPHRPHRYRVLGLVMASGRRPPRHAPRGHRHDIRRR